MRWGRRREFHYQQNNLSFICKNVIYKLPLYMKKTREVITYKSYFDDFFREQSPKVRTKIIKVLDIIEQIDRIPITYLKYIEGTDGLFEIRVQLGNNIFRIFCFFDGNKLVVLLSGFHKKTQKTPPDEISKAVRLKKEYYNEKEKEAKK